MKKLRLHGIFVLVLSTFMTFSLGAQTVQVWDPNGATAGTSVSGDWNTTTTNWTTTADSGVNSAWTQGNSASFLVGADYTVTLTEPISIGNLTATGTAGALTISGTAINNLSLTAASAFNISGSRTVNLGAPIIGAADITKSGNGTLVLSGANTYLGGTTLSGGTLGVGSSSVSAAGVILSGPLGTGPFASSTATIFASGGPRSIENPVTLTGALTNTGSQALTFTNSTFSIAGGSRNIIVNNTADLIIASNLIDDGSARPLTKLGNGRLVLTGNNNTYLGSFTNSAGTVVLGSDAALPPNNLVTVNASTLILDGHDARAFRLAGNAAGSVVLGTNTLTAGNNASSSEFFGVISGTGGYVKVGTISQVLTGTNTFSGGITISEGSIYFPTNGVSGSQVALGPGRNIITITNTGLIGANRGSSTITNDIILQTLAAGLDPASSTLLTLSGQVSGPGGFLRTTKGSGTIIFTGNNTFTGGLQMDARALAFGHKNAIGTGPFTIGNPTVPPGNTIAFGPTIDLSGPNAITNVTTVNQSFVVSATNNFELSGPMTLSNAITVTALGTNSIKFSGIVDGPGALTLAGTNTLILSRANTYAGDTILSGGTLLVENTSGSGTSTGLVTVGFGATLGGKGTISGPVTVSSGGRIAAGSSAGKLTLLNGVDLSGGGTNVWELAAEKDSSTGIGGVDFDELALTGGNLALGGGSKLILQFSGSAAAPTFGNPFWRSNHTWKIVSVSGTAANPGSLNFSGIEGTNTISAGTFTTTVDGTGSILLSYVPGPVPPQPVIESNIAGAGTTSATIQWSAVAGITYQLQYKDDLNALTWSLLDSVTATGPTASIIDTTTPVPAQRFYRVIVP